MISSSPIQNTGVLNGICPYFTMFPLSFPYRLLREHASRKDKVLDPFCGRGTTLYAARMLGMSAYGIDSNPVAVAITRAKLANTTQTAIVAAAKYILDTESASYCPKGEFWQWAYAPSVLKSLCRLRAALLRDASSAARQALVGIILGALHGPKPKSGSSYFSNQCTRTFAPKPAYAVKFWKKRRRRPPEVDVLALITRRAVRFFSNEEDAATGRVTKGDSRKKYPFAAVRSARCNWIITSPPYYGMRTYLPDQWLRLWFLGGPSYVDYTNVGQLNHRSPEIFADELRKVWKNSAEASTRNCRLVIRFGAINDRKVDHLDLIKSSLAKTPWRITTVKPAGTASIGRRQSLHFAHKTNPALCEHDVWAIKNQKHRHRFSTGKLRHVLI